MTTTARILSSSGLSANVGAIQGREFGISLDDERPVVGAPVAGPKWIGTEDFLTLAVPSPSAIPEIKRSILVIHVDTATAGADVNMDIQLGAEVPGTRCAVVVTGSDLALVAYSPGKTFTVAGGSAILFLWTGTEWVPQDPNSYQLAFNASVLGLPYDPTDQYASMKQTIALRHAVDDLVANEGGNDPVTYANAQSSANPSNPEYNPCIPRHDGDHDISTTQTSQATITKLRNKRLTVGGYTSFACTVAGSVITVAGPSTGIRDALMLCLQNIGLANRWKSSGESATYASSGMDWAYASRVMSVNINGVDYPISTLSVASNTITVIGTPAAGAQTLIIYPRRIAGSTTSARLPSLSGFVPIPAGDASMSVIAMAEIMDTIHSHGHGIVYYLVNGAGGAGPWDYITGSTTAPSRTAKSGGEVQVGSPTADGPLGAPRPSKNNSPRTIGVGEYTWLAALFATDWTTA